MLQRTAIDGCQDNMSRRSTHQICVSRPNYWLLASAFRGRTISPDGLTYGGDEEEDVLVAGRLRRRVAVLGERDVRHALHRLRYRLAETVVVLQTCGREMVSETERRFSYTRFRIQIN